MASNRNNRRRFLRMAGGTAVAGAGSMLAGCSSSGGNTNQTTTTDEGPKTANNVETTTADAEIQTGGDLVVAMQSDFETIHPHKIPGTTGTTIVENLGNALVKATPEGEVVPDLAREMPEISDDGLTYTFKIHEGVKFHPPYDREVTAKDVVENWRAILDPEYGAYGRSTYKGILTGENTSPQEAIKQTGKHEITFNLTEPFAPFLIKQAKMSAFGWFNIVPMEAVEEHGDNFGTPDTGVWSTGPFMYQPEESTAGSKYVLKKNPNYFKEGEGGQLPYLDTLTFQISPESTTRTSSLKAGEIEIDESTAATDIQDLKKADGVNVVSMPSSAKTSQWVNRRNYEPLTKTKVRKALMYAANRRAIVETKFRGYATKAHSPLPPWHWAYDKDACVTYDHDVENAKQLLEDAGEGTFSFKCEPTNQPKFVDVAKILQQNYKQVGVDMSIKPASKGTTWSPLVGGWEDESVPPESWHSMIENYTWGFSADDFTYATFHSNQPFNYTYYSNDEADKYMEKARKTRDRKERKEHYAKVQELITDDMPKLFQVWNNVSHGFRDRVHNFDVYPTAYMLFEDVWVDPE
ncbi:ABC transporter substrate-binding protein [Halorussus salinisoli]|uniref:ABC transporter substrate-binding protein n=1 Tax=Halorussus salinisoli TaxID=2558242 RepID=UPI0010C18689|nr:ABC transporter substrate-binding protein [Halorussus salinisoli]